MTDWRTYRWKYTVAGGFRTRNCARTHPRKIEDKNLIKTSYRLNEGHDEQFENHETDCTGRWRETETEIDRERQRERESVCFKNNQ